MMNRVLQRVGQKNSARLSVVIMAVVASFLHGNSSESLFREAAEEDELVAVAVAELNTYYAKSPGFRYARAITIDTSYLEKATGRREVEVRERTSVLSSPRHSSKRLGGRVTEWEGSITGSAGKTVGTVALTRSDGKFHGSYHENGYHHVITPYRSRGKWMTMALVYDGEPPQCGMGMWAKHDYEETVP